MKTIILVIYLINPNGFTTDIKTLDSFETLGDCELAMDLANEGYERRGIPQAKRPMIHCYDKARARNIAGGVQTWR